MVLPMMAIPVVMTVVPGIIALSRLLLPPPPAKVSPPPTRIVPTPTPTRIYLPPAQYVVPPVQTTKTKSDIAYEWMKRSIILGTMAGLGYELWRAVSSVTRAIEKPIEIPIGEGRKIVIPTGTLIIIFLLILSTIIVLSMVRRK